MNIKIRRNKSVTKGEKEEKPPNLCLVLSLISLTLFLISLLFTEVIYDMSVIFNTELILITGIFSISPLLFNVLEYTKIKNVLGSINFVWFLISLTKLLENRNIVYRIYINTENNYNGYGNWESNNNNNKNKNKHNNINTKANTKILGINDDDDINTTKSNATKKSVILNKKENYNVENKMNTDLNLNNDVIKKGEKNGEVFKNGEDQTKSIVNDSGSTTNINKDTNKELRKKEVKNKINNKYIQDTRSVNKKEKDSKNDSKKDNINNLNVTLKNDLKKNSINNLNVTLKNSKKFNIGKKIHLYNTEFNELEEMFLTPSATIIFYMTDSTIFNTLKSRSNIIKSFYNDRSSIGARNRLKIKLSKNQYLSRISGYVKKGIFFIKSKPTEIEIKKLRIIKLGRPNYRHSNDTQI